jgi:antagonist of KipI
MSRMGIEVIKPGSQSSVQGFGVYGMGSQGVAPGGVMDRLSARMANLVIANPPHAPVLEFTLIGPELVFLQARTVSVGGGEFELLLNGAPQACGWPIAVKKGDHLKIGRARWGVRGYLAVQGGFKESSPIGTPLATLKAGDRIELAGLQSGQRPRAPSNDAPGRLAWIKSQMHKPIRVLRGPQAHFFSEDALTQLISQAYSVSPHSNRMGVRLEGPPLRHKGSSEIPSEPNTFGAIQVPPSGLAIILGADLPITGGYPKIATVIEHDHWRIAQARPGDELCFEWCTLQEARRLRAELACLEKKC